MGLVMDLGGDGWQLRGFLGSSWQGWVGPGMPRQGPAWAAARVPGSVLDDLWRAGEVPCPYFERNSLALEWVAARTWVYRRPLDVPALGAGQRATLSFDGVDHRASVFVDGRLVGEHEGSFCPFDLDVTDAVRRPGAKILAVVVHPAPDSEPQAGDTARVRVHKSRMSYGWDFCPRFVHLGIWRGARLHVGAPPFHPRPRVNLSAGEERGEVLVEGAEGLSVYDGDDLVATASGPRLVLDRPKLWWPNGSGRQHLYLLEAKAQGQSRRLRVGFRHVEMAPNPGAPTGARPYTVTVNGRPLFLRGWNWVPLDALYGARRAGKLAHLLFLAAGAGANCLRVWGGGLLETPEFYDLCDELGLLVWQEFSLSSSLGGSVPSDDPVYLATMAAEAPVVVAGRRHHPSLALWCGGNELARQVPGRDDVPLDESTPVIGLLADAVRRHDPGRPFLPTSPSGPRFLNRLDIIAEEPEGQHDVHGPWEHQGLSDHNQLYDAGTCLLHSEVGVEGMTNRRALELLVAPEHRWPADRSNRVYEHLGPWWDNEPLVQSCFGGRLSDLDRLRRASQHLQHDGLRYIVESRLRMRPRTSGVLPWQFNEPYPNAWCTAVVDYWGAPKPAYFGVKRAYRPAHVCARFATWAWAGRGTVVADIYAWPGPASVEARLVATDGTMVAARHFTPGAVQGEPGDVMAPVGRFGVALDLVPTPLFLLDLSARAVGGATCSNRYLLSGQEDLSAVLELAPAAVEVSCGPGLVSLSHRSGPAALGLVLEDGRPAGAPGWAVFEDNVIDLLPGEARTVGCLWRDAPEGGRRVLVEGWNVPRQVTVA